ncbi:MAG: LytTR family transcriptional regulator [Oscillospiraceae bacterium]|nr:LytTR family transcriptional regulator [Oscillospiraceae bacterium]
MRIRLSVSGEKYDSVKTFLEEHGVEISDEAEYMISESSRYAAFLSLRDDRRERVRLSVDEVIFIEAFGKDVEVHTEQGTYWSQDRMYQLEELLDPARFLRVSKSVIISGRHVKKIRPSLSMKYILTMTNGMLVDVTRSYYTEFRKYFGI